MKKQVIGLLVLLYILPLALANVDDEFKKITHYAEEYETGNIDYVKLIVYTSSARENLNEELGSVSREFGGLLKQEEIKKFLGAPSRETKWAWVEQEEREIKLDAPLPVWEKIIFDGKKIRIKLEAHPSIFKKGVANKYFDAPESDDEEEKERIEKEKKMKQEMFEKSLEFDEKGIAVIYRLNFNTEFKRPEEQMDITGKINEVKELASAYNSEPSESNAEALAKESVNAEKSFHNNFEEGRNNCAELMNSIFGSENKRQVQKIYSQEIDFFEGENFEVIARLEMCDDCEWNWVNLDMWLEGRGPGFKQLEESKNEQIDDYKNLDFSGFEAETIRLVDEIKKSLEQKNFEAVSSLKARLWPLNDAWNKKSNDVWKEADEKYAMPVVFDEKNNPGMNDPYYWIKREIEKREYAEQLAKSNFEKRKNFYLSLFSGYDKKESYIEEISWEKRLIEEFKEFGRETCDNNQDDNKNEKVDCDDEQCGGKICGKQKIDVSDGNQTIEKYVDLYCVEKKCQQKEEIIVDTGPVCGNHICETGENDKNNINSVNSTEAENREISGQSLIRNLYCPQDCIQCLEHEPIECENGKVMFSGKDEQGCLLKPICVEEKTCLSDSDCEFRCGVGKCNLENEKGICELVEITECREAECADGEKKIEKCNNGDEIIIGICKDGLWEEIDVQCAEGKTEIECVKCGNECVPKDIDANRVCTEPTEDFECIKKEGSCFVSEKEEIIGEGCTVKEDCGNPNDVCSNGKCITLPEVIEEEEEVVEVEISEEDMEKLREKDEVSDREIWEEESSERDDEREVRDNQREEEQKENVNEQEPVTGNVVFNFFAAIGRFTGKVITGFDAEEIKSETAVESEPANQENDKEDNGISEEDRQREDDDRRREDEDRRRDEENDKRNEEDRQRREENCEKDCDRNCEDRLMRPCVEKCVFDREKNKDETGDLEECKQGCKNEVDLSSCTNECVSFCMEGNWEEFNKKFDQKQEEHKEEKGVFVAGGSCRTEQGKIQSNMWFSGWGDPFENIEKYKRKYYDWGGDWCKWDLENSIKQRIEMEKGLNQEFAKWFFEDYLAGSAEEWEQHMSGLFELYWKNVDISRMMAERMQCLGKNDITEVYQPQLIKFEYSSEYGKIEYWEELKEVKMDWMEQKVKIVTPYMKVWIYPPEGFVKYEMKKSMEKHEFPGRPEEKLKIKNEGFPPREVIDNLRNNNKFMEKLEKISENSGGELNGVLQIIDPQTEEVIFNMYVQVSESYVIKLTPMLVSEVPEQEVKITVPFDKIYDMVLFQEKNFKGAQIESPPWARKGGGVGGKVNEVVNGIKMYFKARSLMNSIKVYPEDDKSSIKGMLQEFMESQDKRNEKDRDEAPSEEDMEKLKNELSEEELKEFEEMGKEKEKEMRKR